MSSRRPTRRGSISPASSRQRTVRVETPPSCRAASSRDQSKVSVTAFTPATPANDLLSTTRIESRHVLASHLLKACARVPRTQLTRMGMHRPWTSRFGTPIAFSRMIKPSKEGRTPPRSGAKCHMTPTRSFRTPSAFHVQH